MPTDETNVRNKWTSRKFWLAVAAFLGSIGTGIAGIVTDNDTVAAVGIVCSILSAAIYAAAEAYTDGEAIRADTKTTTVSASTSDRKLVGAALNTTAPAQQPAQEVTPNA